MPATPSNRPLSPAHNSPVLRADPTDSRFLVLANRLDAPDFSCALHVSGDGGQGWTSTLPLPTLPPGVDKCYAPEVAFDGNGALHYLFVGLAGAGNEPVGAFLTSSTDRARTFTPPRQVLGPLNFSVRMAVDPTVGKLGRMHLVWLHASSDPPLGGFGPPPNPILAAHSDDGGITFTEPVQVSDPTRSLVVAPALALGPNRSVHVGYFDLEEDVIDYRGLEGSTWNGTWSLVVSSSVDGGRKFEQGVVVDDAVTPAERVMLIFTMPPAALVAHGQRVCAAWTDARNGDADAVLRCSDDRGRSFGGALHRLNDDPVGNGRRQYLPQLSVSPEGRVDAVFFDRRHDPRDIHNDVFYTFSTDGIRSFAPNLRLTRASSLSLIGQQYAHLAAQGQYEFGSRLALLSLPSRAIAAWPDTRNSLVVPGNTEQQLFVTTVAFPDQPSSLGFLGVGLLAVGLLTVALSLWSRRRDDEAVAQ